MVEMADTMEDIAMIKGGGAMIGVDNHQNKGGIRRIRRNQVADVQLGRPTRGMLLAGLAPGQRDPSLVAMATTAAAIGGQQKERLNAMLM